MSIIKKMRKQTAVWWERSTLPDAYGKYTYAAPLQIECRWDDSAVEYRNQQGQAVLSSATVYVDRVMKIGDMLMRGDWESDTADDPTDEPTAFEIQRFDQNPNIKATETLLTAFI